MPGVRRLTILFPIIGERFHFSGDLCHDACEDSASADSFLARLQAKRSSTLWPAMLVHAAIDWNSGEVGYFVLNTADA